MYSLRIFWTDCCVTPRIWSADLSGSYPLMLTDKVEWPAGIVCDVANQRLYWTDSKLRTISTMTVHGKDLRTIYTFSGRVSAYPPPLLPFLSQGVTGDC